MDSGKILLYCLWKYELMEGFFGKQSAILIKLKIYIYYNPHNPTAMNIFYRNNSTKI